MRGGYEGLYVRTVLQADGGVVVGVAQAGVAALAWIFAQVSRSVTVRLKTGRPGVESGSAQK